MSNELRLSVSKCKVFSDCKKKYHFAYVLKFPQRDEDYHVLGKFCHKVLEDFHNAYINGSFEPYNKIMSIAFKTACGLYKDRLSDEMKQECWKMINQYLKLVTDAKKNGNLPNILSCEKEFSIDIIDNVVLKGVIDRVQIDQDDMLHIVDYKSSKSKEFQKKDWTQLMTYAYAILLDSPEIKRVRTSYVMLRHDYEYITKEFDANEIVKIKDKYIEYAENIKKETDFAPNPGFMCKFCSFLDHCVEGQEKVRPNLAFGALNYD